MSSKSKKPKKLVSEDASGNQVIETGIYTTTDRKIKSDQFDKLRQFLIDSFPNFPSRLLLNIEQWVHLFIELGNSKEPWPEDFPDKQVLMSDVSTVKTFLKAVLAYIEENQNCKAAAITGIQLGMSFHKLQVRFVESRALQNLAQTKQIQVGSRKNHQRAVREGERIAPERTRKVYNQLLSSNNDRPNQTIEAVIEYFGKDEDGENKISKSTIKRHLRKTK